MNKAILVIMLSLITTTLYASTEVMAGISGDIINEKSFDIFSNNDWLFGPAIRIEQNIIAGRPLYLNLSLMGSTSSNEIFDGVKTELALLYLSGGVSYRHNVLSDIVHVYGGINFIYGFSDIKFSESVLSYTDSSVSYGATLYGGLRLNFPQSIIRGEGWEKQHWHELITFGLDIQAGYKILTPFSFENLRSSEGKAETARQYNVGIGEINTGGPYIITSVVFVF
ncbi:MAG: hypothetical protein N3B13_09610 [Deltaproteobacteria bacterium]|nr:hypothetical protein [Deltaproteobacteria bacterium]